MTVIDISASRDTYLQSNEATTVKGSTGTIWTGEPNNQASAIHNMLLYFDMSSVPAGSTINSATLYLRHFNSDYADNARTMQVYRVIRAWVENQATWNVAKTGTNWGTAGCNNTTTDYDSTSLGSRLISATEAAGWKTWTLDAAVIQDIVDGDVDYEGFLLRSGTQSNDAQAYRSKDYGTNTPYLQVDYTVSGMQFQAIMIGG